MSNFDSHILKLIFNLKFKLIPFAREVINSMIYKRLKGLKQLGNTHEVYPTANHTRFEHCIGVYHLGKLEIKVFILFLK